MSIELRIPEHPAGMPAAPELAAEQPARERERAPVWAAAPPRPRKHRLLIPLGLLVLDTLALALAFWFGYLIRFGTTLLPLERVPESPEFYMLAGTGAGLIWLVLFAANHLYDLRELFGGIREYVRVINTSTVAVVLVMMINFLHAGYPVARGWFLTSWVLAIVFVVSERFLVRRVVRQLRRHGLLMTPTVIVGANEEGAALAEQLLADDGSGVLLLGFLDSSLPPATRVVGDLEVLGDFLALDELIIRRGARQVIVATTALSRNQLLDLYWNYGHHESIELHLSSGLFEIVTTGVAVQEISSVPLVSPQRLRITGIEALLKSALDYAIATVGLVATAPVLLLISALIRLDSPGPILHRRRVLGVSGRVFEALKFRTMVVDADHMLVATPSLRAAFEQSYKLKADPRVTRFGRFLRRTSLDELPQLINVLRGEMSLVGPRMIAPDEAARYGKWQRNLVTVKPGITGPWQVQGRGDLPYDQRVKLSMEYIRNYTLWLDLLILLRTVLVVLKGKGAY